MKSELIPGFIESFKNMSAVPYTEDGPAPENGFTTLSQSLYDKIKEACKSAIGLGLLDKEYAEAKLERLRGCVFERIDLITDF